MIPANGIVISINIFNLLNTFKSIIEIIIIGIRIAFFKILRKDSFKNELINNPIKERSINISDITMYILVSMIPPFIFFGGNMKFVVTNNTIINIKINIM